MCTNRIFCMQQQLSYRNAFFFIFDFLFVCKVALLILDRPKEKKGSFSVVSVRRRWTSRSDKNCHQLGTLFHSLVDTARPLITLLDPNCFIKKAAKAPKKINHIFAFCTVNKCPWYTWHTTQKSHFSFEN